MTTHRQTPFKATTLISTTPHQQTTKTVLTPHPFLKTHTPYQHETAQAQQKTEQMKIAQHNVLNWKERKFGLTHIYKTLGAYTILINIHGVPSNKPLKMHW